MKIKESVIRENIAKNINLLDKNLRVVAEEHYINMPSGRTAYVDILAKDDFGCFTLIELKKSDQTARSAIQQLMKYANMLKEKNRLEESQIRCIVISTVWRELEEAFDEYSRVSQYEFKGFSVVYRENQKPVFQEIHPKYDKGDMSPLRNFIFFEFNNQEERDRVYFDFSSTLEKLPSCNSVVIKMNYSGDDSRIIHPYGFSWTMFTTNTSRLEEELSKLPVKSLDGGDFDIGGILYLWQLDGKEYELRTKILLDQVRLLENSGEYTGLALHSLNNTLGTWDCQAPKGFGQMFSDSLFDNEDMVSMSCGFTGDHPYGFIIKTTPSRPNQFNMIRRKLDKFLSTNVRWQNQADYVLNGLAEGDVADIYIYNPLNFFGLIYDIKKNSFSERIPSLLIKIERKNGSVELYQGMLAWTQLVSNVNAKQAVADSYGSIDSLKTRMISQRINEHDEKLSEKYGLTYETYYVEENSLYRVQCSDEGCYLERIDKVITLDDFIKNNDDLIEEVDYLLNKDADSSVKIMF
ncbi:Endonuclease NucS [Vreelandella titanicae]